MLKRILKELNEKMGLIYVRQIIQNNNQVFIYLSDIYGNIFYEPPMAFSLFDGKPVSYEEEDILDGYDCSIPKEYLTYKTIVYERLKNDLSVSLWNDAGGWGYDFPINALFMDYVSDIDLPQLYALCNFLINLFVSFCSDEEKNDFFLAKKNDTISGFLQLSMEDKLKLVDDYYFIPKYIQEVIEKSDEMLCLAEQKKSGNALDENRFQVVKSEIDELLKEAEKKLLAENDSCCSIKKMHEKIKDIAANVEQEYSYCENKSKVLSDRMKQREEWIKNSGEKGAFGMNEPFSAKFIPPQ